MAGNKGKTLVTNLLFKGTLDPSVKKSILNVEKSFNALNSSVNKIFKGVAVATAAIGTAAAGATLALYKMGESWNDAARTIRLGTGATGKDLDALTESMQRVYETLPAGMDNVASTIADINTLTGASGEALEKFAQATLQAAHLMGSDAKALYEPVSKAMNAFGVPVEQAAEKMDWLWKVSQSTGAGIGELAEAAKAGQNAFRTLGFSFEESTALLGQMDKAGLKGEAALAALKKAVTSLSEAGVKDFSKGFAAVTEKIKSAKTETEAFNIATKVFGTKGGAEMAKAIRENKLAVDDLVKTLQASDETIARAFSDTATGGEKLTVLWHKVQSAIKPAADAVYKALQRIIPIFERLVARARPAIEKLAAEFSAKAQEMSEAFSAWVDSIDFDTIAAGVSSVIAKAREWVGIIAENTAAIGKWAKRIGIAMAAIKGISVAIAGVKMAMSVWAFGKTLVLGFIGVLKLCKLAILGVWKGMVKMKAWGGWVKIWTGLQVAWNASMVAGKKAILTIWKGMKALFVWHNWLKVATALQWAFNVALNANPIGLIVVAVLALIAAGWALYENWDDICAFLREQWDGTCKNFSIMWDAICSALSASWEWLKEKFSAFGAFLGEQWDGTCQNFSRMWDAITSALSGSWEWLKEQFSAFGAFLRDQWDGTCKRFTAFISAMGDVFTRVWKGIKDVAMGVIDSIMEYLQPLIDAIKGVFDTLGNIKDGIKNAASSAWDGTKNAAGAAWNGTKNAAGAAWDKLKGWFASGGFTDGPSICGENGTEAVISFDPAYRAQNQAYLMSAAEMLGMTAAPAAARVESRATTFNLGGITFSPVIKAGSSVQASSIMKQLKSSIPDLVDAIEQELAKRQSTRYA